MNSFAINVPPPQPASYPVNGGALSISEGSYNPHISLLNQFMTAELGKPSVTIASVVTAQAPANNTVLFAVAPPKA
jgi:hypothetical protein